MTYVDALSVLESEGLRVTPRAFGIEGWSDDSDGRLTFAVGRSSDGGDDLSIRRSGPGAALPGGPVRWFWSPTVEDLVAFLVAAHRDGKRRSTSLFTAMVERAEAGGTPVRLRRFE